MRVVVTGASGALGRAVLKAFAARGDQVAGVARRSSADVPTGVSQIICGDLADADAAHAGMAEAQADLGGIDALVLLAGGFSWVTVETSRAETWHRLHRDNVETALNAIHAALTTIADGGSIICVGAASAQPSGVGMAPYAAAKSGVARLVEALAAELKDRRIRANAILPAIIDTPRNRADMPDADPAQWTTPDAIADVVLFLSSPQARAINGALIPVTNNG